MTPRARSARRAARRADCYPDRISFPARRGLGRVRWSEKPVCRSRLPVVAHVISITGRYARRNNDALKSCKKRPTADLNIAVEPDLQDPGRDRFGKELPQSCHAEFLFGQFCLWRRRLESFHSASDANPTPAGNIQSLDQVGPAIGERLPGNAPRKLDYACCRLF